eukprot:jgi/Undpi1/2064/HiC_scaffold_12.g05450.m1
MDHTPHLWQGVGAAPVIPPPSQEAAKKSSGAALGVSASMGDTHADISPVGSNVPSAIASGAAVESADRLASDRAVGKTGPAGTGKSRSASPSRESAPPPLPGISMTSMSSSTSSARSAGRRKAARPKKIVTDEETAKLCALRQRRATARQERAAARGAAKTECGMGAKASASGAGLCGGKAEPATPPPPQEEIKKPSGDVPASSTAIEAANGHALGETVGKAGPDPDKLVRHMPMVVAIATGSYGVFKKDDKAFEEARKSAPSATLEHLSRKERRRQQAKDRPIDKPEKTLMAALGAFFMVVAEKKAGEAVDAPPGILTFLSDVDGLNQRRQSDAAEVLTMVLQMMVSNVTSDKAGGQQAYPWNVAGAAYLARLATCSTTAKAKGKPIPEPFCVLQDFYVLALAMPSVPNNAHKGLASSPLHLTDLLGQYFEDEHGLDPCAECKLKGRKTYKKSRSIALAKPPGRLFLHIKRFKYASMYGGLQKINDLVKLPLELDMAPFMQGREDKVLYNLDGIVHHATDPEDSRGGHYTAYVHLGGGRWRWYNDTVVTTCSMNDTIAAGALVVSYTMRK